MGWQTLLQEYVLSSQHDSVHVLDERAYRLISSLLPDVFVGTREQTPDRRCALAVGIEACAGLTVAEAEQLISQTRLYVAPRIMLAERPDGVLDERAFRALGFTVRAVDTAGNMNVYDYDLDTYKSVPDWLNARYWANPERWEP
ncbi:MAG: hypothetical protein IV085_13105 [Thiobacillus sp.]|nr:hypothetical protein [Thiobacillus sp.]